MTGNAIREALEPCPFCGEREALKAETRGARGVAGNIEEGWVECQNCGARGETEYGACEPDDMIRLVQGGWNRRARTAYDAIGSGVKADSGWVEWTGGETPVEPGTEGLIRVEDGEVIYTKQLGSFNFAHDRSGPFPGRRIVAYRVLSTHTAAGAGLAGEPVAWQRRLSGPKVKDAGWHVVSQEVAAYAVEHGHPEGLPDVNCEVRPLYARPVEEPGEVERNEAHLAHADAYQQTAMKNLARAETAEAEVVRLTLAVEDSLQAAKEAEEARNEAMRGERAAEAALAETRERLEKVEVAARETLECFEAAYVEGLEHQLADQADHSNGSLRGLIVRRLLPVVEIVRAALTGDAQEAGR